MKDEAAALRDNRANWDERAEIHVASKMYSVAELVADSGGISSVVVNDYEVLRPHLPNGSVAGLTLLHLQCHIGTDTLSWARLGATDVHGLDFSPNSLTHARQIAKDAGADINYVEGDARDASAVLDRSFDVIVTSVGAICWLSELTGWARSIHDLLVPGGVFMIRDDHPLVAAMEPELCTVAEDYLGGGGMVTYQESDTYTDMPPESSPITHTTNHSWQHDLAEVMNALISAGLKIEAVGEYPFTDWKPFPNLVPCPQGWTLPENTPRIPLTFSVVARRPA